MIKIRIVLFAVIFLALNLIKCGSNNTVIPSGVYELLENKDKSASNECKIIENALGNTLIIDNDSILTSILHESEFEKYAIINVKKNAYGININHSSATPIIAGFLYEPENHQMEFCNGRMKYKKIK